MNKQDQESLQKVLDRFTLDDLLRIGLMLALRDKQQLTAYFLEMALIDHET